MTLDKLEVLILDPDIISKARAGDHSAQLVIGRAYYQATRVEDNCYDAFKWIKASADQGNAEAQFLLADMYSLGHGVDQDFLAAHEWYTKSALQDYPKALIRVHNLYHEDKKIYCRGELNSEEEGMNEPEFKKKNGVRELNEYRLKTMQADNRLGNTVDFFSKQFKDLTESEDKDADTMYKLGFHYHHGYGVREIPKRAIECYTVAAEKGHTNAQYNLGYLYQENTDIKFNYRHAFKWLKPAAETGHSAAQNCLAYFFEKGIVVEMDLSEALRWYSKAAANNNKGAMVNIARMYRKGLVDDQPNYSQSIEWYKKAAQLGSPAAKNCLYQLSQRKDSEGSNDSTEDGLLYGELSVKDRLCSKLRVDVSAMSHDPDISQLERLASHALVGDGNAMLGIGIKYFNGSDLTQDKETGLKWIQNSAKSGLLKAQLLVGKLYEDGRTDVVRQDYHKAAIYYSQAAKQKSDVAQHKKGLLYYHGHGLRKDPLEASRWFTWSANQNNSDAQCMLGLLRTTGEGLGKDDLEAFQWFTKSGSQRNLQALYHLGVIERRGTTFFKDGSAKKGQAIDVVPKKNIKRALSLFKYAASFGLRRKNSKKGDSSFREEYLTCQRARVYGCLDAQLLLAKMYDEGDNLHKDSNEAFQYYTQAAKKGNAEATYKVGYMYLEGRGIKQDYIKAYRYITKAAEKNHPVAKSLLVAPIKETFKNIDYAKVLKMFEAVTLNGLASLEYNIGLFYEGGFGDHNSRRIIEENVFYARCWYKQAEEKKNPDVIHKLGILYQFGILGQPEKLYQFGEVSRMYGVAYQYFRMGAELKHPDSLYALGQLHLRGKGAPKNLEEAFNLFFEAASLGHSESRSVLSLLYGTKTSIESSFNDYNIIEMMREVGNNGNAIVQYRFGCYYESSNNIDLAIKWYRLAAKGDVTDAYYRLGRIYETKGYQNYSKAIESYEAAFDNNHDEAIYRAAQLYHSGIGFSQDYAKAFQLYTKAASLGNESAIKLLDITNVFKIDGVDTTNGTKISNSSTIGHKFFNITSQKLKELLLMREYVAKSGNVDQQYCVAYIYENGLESPNFEKAFQWYSMAASSSHKDAVYRLGLLYLNGNGHPQNWTLAAENFKKAMNLGSVDAYYQFGSMHTSGKVVQYYIVAAEKGHCDAQFKIGELCEDGGLEGKCFLDALKWYTKAYFQGSSHARAHLYTLDGKQDFEKEFYSKLFKKMDKYNKHDYGRLSEDNVLDLKRRYKQIADNKIEFYGYVHFQLGYMYFSGNGVEANYEKAWRHFDISHKVFNTRQALYFMNIETKDSKDLGTPTNLKKIEMFNAVDSKLDAEQLYQLAYILYKKSRFKQTFATSILNRDDKFTINLLKKSLEQGNSKAIRLLGDMYYYGYGTKVDFEKGLQNHIEWASRQEGRENFRIGLEYYDNKEGEIHSWAIALVYIIKASNQKNADAQKHLRDVFHSGQNAAVFIKKEREIHDALANQQISSENLDDGLRYYYGCGSTKKNPLTGLIYLQRAASEKNPTAQRILGDIYYYGNNVNKNREKAKELHKSSSRQLSATECFRLGQSYYIGSKMFTKNHEIAIIYFNESITEGNYEALRHLGDIYFSGDIVEMDKEKALQLHEKFAITLTEERLLSIGQAYYNNEYYSIAAIYLRKTNGNDPTVFRHLGNMYNEGENVEKNQEKSLWFHDRSASLFTKEMNYRIGFEYFNGSDQSKQNTEVGLIYINKAINQGSSIATRFMADKYCYGDGGIDKNQAKSLKLHQASAARFDMIDNFRIGREYYQGSKSIQRNVAASLIYLNTAAFDQESSEALQYLGDLFYDGHGDINKDQAKALKLHQASAVQSDRYGNFRAGRKYYEGSKDSKRSTAIGFIYLNRAAFDQGSSEALQYLGDLFYYGGDGINKDQAKVLQLHEKSAARNHYHKNFDIGKEYYESSKDVTKNTIIGLIYLNRAAFDQGSSEALQYLGDLFYYGGDGINKDQEKALQLHERSATLNHSYKNFDTGKEYYKGSKNLKKNPTIGFIYLNRAAFDQDSSEVLQYLGDLFYYGGDGINKDQEKALQLHERSAARNYGRTYGHDNFDIGKEYYEGSKNLKKNITVSLIYLNRAAFDQDTSKALQYLGDLFYYGSDGINKDQEKALQLHERSAARNYGYDNFDIGKEYYEGSKNLKKNITVSLIYLNRAAFDQDSSKALQYLGDLFYYGGDSFNKDQEKALQLHERSAARNYGYRNFDTGKEYYEGSKNLKKNITVSLIYLNRAAFDQDSSKALQYLGDLLYYGGDVINEDQAKVLKLHERLAARNHAHKNFDIGKGYYEGSKDLKKNPTIGFIYLSNALDQDPFYFRSYLGDIHYFGEVYEKEPKRALDLIMALENDI